jgi:hypothetical protein
MAEMCTDVLVHVGPTWKSMHVSTNVENPYPMNALACGTLTSNFVKNPKNWDPNFPIIQIFETFWRTKYPDILACRTLTHNHDTSRPMNPSRAYLENHM